MKFRHDDITAPFPGVLEALAKLEDGAWKYFSMDYAQYRFIQVAYADCEGFTVEMRDGKKSDLVAYNAQSKDASSRLITDISNQFNGMSETSNSKNSVEPSFFRAVRVHVYVSLLPVVLYLGFLTYFGYKTCGGLGMSIMTQIFVLAALNGLISGVVNGRFTTSHGRSCELTEQPVAFMFCIIINAILSIGAFVFSIFVLLTR